MEEETKEKEEVKEETHEGGETTPAPAQQAPAVQSAPTTTPPEVAPQQSAPAVQSAQAPATTTEVPELPEKSDAEVSEEKDEDSQ